MTLTIALLEAGQRLSRQLGVWLARSQTRRRLATLPERQLRDIGLDTFWAEQEAQKPFWQPFRTMSGEDAISLEGAARSVPARRHVPRALRPAATFSAVLVPWRS
jgi:uncharacterized protein YjiS (DUF1127 family)